MILDHWIELTLVDNAIAKHSQKKKFDYQKIFQRSFREENLRTHHTQALTGQLSQSFKQRTEKPLRFS